jgi:hypothetical protein
MTRPSARHVPPGFAARTGTAEAERGGLPTSGAR